MLEGNRVSRISVRGFAVASATAVTAVGSVVGVASGSTAQTTDDAEAVANDTTLLADIPVGQQAQVQTASLTAQADAQAIERRNAERRGDMLRIEVLDLGPGFTPEMMANFGKPYSSTKARRGAGLGLFLVSNVIRKFGGRVSAQNREAGGATVTVELPLAQSKDLERKSA